MPSRSCLAIVLAAGEGTRMRSALPKVMHKVGGLPMLGHVLAAAKAAGADRLAVVVGPGVEAVRTFIGTTAPDAAIYEQMERRGTAHAVLAAKKEITAGADDVIVLYGDTPLVTPKTLQRLRRALAKDADVVALGFRTANPTGYGRLIVEKGRLVAIREEKDATKEERAVDFCNAGIMGFRGEGMLNILRKIGNDNTQGEFYLPDAVAVAVKAGKNVAALEGDAEEFLGINSRAELSAVEGIFQKRMREEVMAGGVTMIAPKTVWFSYDTKIGGDVTIEPDVFFGPGVAVADGATIRAFSHLEGARVASGAVVGPYARLRPGAAIGEKARVGNFVEIKNAGIDAGAKVNHLTYIGDAHIGAGANIGAGTITCNYDGIDKHHTEIGDGAFIGSNSSLVAPVTIGKNAYVASGSVITEDVPDEAMAVARGRQVTKPGWAARRRSLPRVKKPEA